MDAKAEAKALEDGKRHAKEFCNQHGISDEEWQHALDCSEAYRVYTLDLFWKLREEENVA
jgi:phosphoribosylamine-glycine ligase